MSEIKEPNNNAGETNQRNPKIALLLSICPGLGQLYSGKWLRAVILYCALIIISWLSAILFMFMESRISIVFFAVPVIGFCLIAIDAYILAGKQEDDFNLKKFNNPLIYGLIFIVLLFTVNPLMDTIVGKNVTRACLSNTRVMEPAILMNDVLLVNKLAYSTSDPKRGDVVYIPRDKEESSGGLTKIVKRTLIRRVIGLPGETVEIRDKKLYLNNKEVNEPYAYYSKKRAVHVEDKDFGPTVVPTGSYFLLGDDRSTPLDSRTLGFIKRDQINGKITKVYWSWNFEGEGMSKIKWGRVGLPVK